ncbi:MAG TPA: hypothetical protein VJO99_04400 [Burkholderiaceae bacterium]|nr:hypothetical protein [Burkholderiaceae bacterium]
MSHAAEPEFSGQVRAQYLDQRANTRGPLAAADAVAPGLVELPSDGVIAEAELRASAHAGGVGFNGIATLQSQRFEGSATDSRAWLNELYASADAAGWQFSAGKKIVAWDVGYGFRPNDFVQQEARRTLLSVTPEGRPVLTAEHFDASTAWTFVLVNTTHARDERGPDEPALAARVYQRDGAWDWHGFARLGARTGPSAGGAFAWVASESLELHASVRYLARADTLASTAPVTSSPLVAANPWQPASVSHAVQALAGGTWTNEQQLSLLVEAWWDGTALRDSQWDDWAARNARLGSLTGLASVPAAALAGNLAWQASAFNASGNLRRANLFVRASWQHDKWQPAVDVLYTPADAGRIVTASLGWQGDRVRLDGGLRLYAGPSGAVLAQVPTRRIVYVAGTWAF